MKKYKLIKIFLIILVIILLVLLVIRAININSKNEKFELQYPKVKEALENFNSKYIGGRESSAEGFEIDYYTEFQYDLYEDSNSNEMFYTNVIRAVASANEYFSFRLIDDSKKILIAVVCNPEERIITQKYINGEINYFGKRNSEISIAEYKQAKIRNIIPDALELKEIINENWAETVDLGTKTGTIMNHSIYSRGIEARSVYGKVFNIVFTRDYKNNVVNGIAPGTPLEEIKQEFGEPDFCEDLRIYIRI